MKQSVLSWGLALSILFAMSPGVEAGEQYWMFDVGALWKDDSKYDPDMMTSASLTYGYAVNTHWAFELDYLRSLSGGSYSRADSSLAAGKETGDYSLWMSSLSLNYRHLLGESFYLKGNLAYNYSEEDRSSSVKGMGNYEVLYTGAFGVGAGFLLGDVIGSSLTAEIEYTYYSNDMMGLTVGANITF